MSGYVHLFPSNSNIQAHSYSTISCITLIAFEGMKNKILFCCRNQEMDESQKKIIMVTGGTGLVGMAIKQIVETDEHREDEQWIFVSSKDANLTYVKRYF